MVWTAIPERAEFDEGDSAAVNEIFGLMGQGAMMLSMESLHISEADLTRDIRAILQRVETGTEVIITRNRLRSSVRPAR